MLDVSMPIELVTRETLVGMYELGKTTSDPETFLDLILGVQDPELMRQLAAAMQRRGVA
jgi:hypothetical protein